MRPLVDYGDLLEVEVCEFTDDQDTGQRCDGDVTMTSSASVCGCGHDMTCPKAAVVTEDV